MKEKSKPIELAVKELKENLDTVARVSEWADLMGYKRTKLFSRHFLKQHSIRPKKILLKIRLKSIIQILQNSQKSCYEIARLHSLPDEKALNSFVKRHLGISPSKVKTLEENKLQELWVISRSENGE
jgi:transcriptional regulator GlxA family with amidase domain